MRANLVIDWLRGRLRPALARDMTVALVLKLVLLASVLAVLSRVVVRPSDTAEATAAAVAGISAPAESSR